MLERVDVISDVVCPWCYIGKRRLAEALDQWQARHPEQTPEVTWHPFQLNPDLPAAGVPRQDYVARKFGGPERAREIYARVAAAGREAGIAFDFDAMQVQPNTAQAHRLIAWSADHGAQDALVEALFQGYFLDVRDLTRDAVLAELASRAGLDPAAAAAFLASDALDAEVAADERAARDIGVEGVPFFVFNRRLAVSGAQPAAVLLEAMTRASVPGATHGR
ncbi:MAG: DsbA family oxidoreductase [Betaproteobacteria bacterium]|jgi:predicted DsbA family dithiol-disulfide isomerase